MNENMTNMAFHMIDFTTLHKVHEFKELDREQTPNVHQYKPYSLNL